MFHLSLFRVAPAGSAANWARAGWRTSPPTGHIGTAVFAGHGHCVIGANAWLAPAVKPWKGRSQRCEQRQRGSSGWAPGRRTCYPRHSERGFEPMVFSVGETVVYPHQGAAVIDAIETRVIKGEEKQYLVLRVAQGDLTVRVPAEN